MNLKSYTPVLNKPIIEQMFNYRFSVFTPVFNRADTIHRVFESLDKQTFKNFELIIINDGSTDNSHDVIKHLIKTAKFKVVYVNNKLNQHKMACFFQAINIAQGEFLLTLDSDDACSNEALATFDSIYESLSNEKKNILSGMTSLCMNSDNEIIGDKFPQDIYFSNSFKQSALYPRAAERWGFVKTEILKNIKINNNMFSKGLIPEGLIWEFISFLGYETCYVNKALRVYFFDANNRLSIRNHRENSFGMAIFSVSVLNWFSKKYLLKYPQYFLKRIYTLLRASKYLDYDLKTYLHSINNYLIKIIIILAWPLKKYFKY